MKVEIETIIISAAGATLAGVSLYLIKYIHQKKLDNSDSKKIRDWLQEDNSKYDWHSTRTIASSTNLPIDRVAYLCSQDKLIKLTTGEKEDLWALRNKNKEKKAQQVSKPDTGKQYDTSL